MDSTKKIGWTSVVTNSVLSLCWSSDNTHQTWWQVFAAIFVFIHRCDVHSWTECIQNVFECMLSYLNALMATYNGSYTTVNLSLNTCTTLRRRTVLRFVSNILKPCFILEKQNTINNNIIPVSVTRNGNLMCGFVLSSLCVCCANGAAVCYWEEASEYMRQKNTTRPPWALLNINTRQHSKNIQRNTPMYGRKEVRAVGWNALILQTLDLVIRWNIQNC